MEWVGLLSAWQHKYLPSSPKRSQPGEIKSLVAQLVVLILNISLPVTHSTGVCVVSL